LAPGTSSSNSLYTEVPEAETREGTAPPHLQEEVKAGGFLRLSERDLERLLEVLYGGDADRPSRAQTWTSLSSRAAPSVLCVQVEGENGVEVRVGVPARSSTSPSRRWPGSVVHHRAAHSSTVPARLDPAIGVGEAPQHAEEEPRWCTATRHTEGRRWAAPRHVEDRRQHVAPGIRTGVACCFGDGRSRSELLIRRLRLSPDRHTITLCFL
jgi:hypothetical protein